MNRTLFVLGKDCLTDDYPETECMIDVKGCTIPVQIPIRSQLIESIFDYCRIIYDVLPQEAQLSVSIEDTISDSTSSGLHILNDWEWSQQSFLYITQQMVVNNARLKQINAYISIDKKKTIERAFQHLFKDVKKLHHGDQARMIYLPKVIQSEQLQKFEMESVQDIFEIFRNARKRGNWSMCKLDVIVPVLSNANSHPFYSNSEAPFLCKTFNFKQKIFVPSLPLDSMRVWYIAFDHLWNTLLGEMIQRYYALVVANIQGIPMKDTESKANYDVQLACRSVPIEISQDLSVTSSFLNLKWYRADPKINVEHYYMTRSVHRVTPLYPYTMPTLCLMKHLASGKPVTLSISGASERLKVEVTHLMLQHGSDVYLHVLHPSKMFYPWLTIPRIAEDEKDKPPYRSFDFEEFIRIHKLRSNVPTISASLENSNLQQDTSTSTSVSSDIELKPDLRAQLFTLMKHNRFIYEVPASIERCTRYFPLCADSESMMFCNTTHVLYPMLYSQIVHPLWEYAVKKTSEQLNEQDLKHIHLIINKLYLAAHNNELSLLPEIQDHTRRFVAYRKLWSEIRMLAITMDHSEHILSIMDKKWPQFFYDKSSTEQTKTQEQSRRSKRMIEVQRDRYGNVIFPIPLGALTIHSLGKVVYDRPNYHTDKYIWPVGYKATRYYTSVKDTNSRCLYTCEIHDGGDSPIFVLTSEDNPDQPIRASSATAAWTVIVKKVNEIKTEEAGKRVFTNVSGPEYYGLAHPTVMKLISELPNAEKCVRPNAPHQPAAKQSLVTTKNEAEDSEDEDLGNKSTLGEISDASAVTTNEEQSTAISQQQSTNTSTQISNLANNITFRRQQRDKKAIDQAHASKMKMANIDWKKNVSLLKFFKQRESILDEEAPILDGRQEGIAGLYAYLGQQKESQQQFQPQQQQLQAQLPSQQQIPGLQALLPHQVHPQASEQQVFQPTQADNLNAQDKGKKQKSKKKTQKKAGKKRKIGNPPLQQQMPTKQAKMDQGIQ